MGTRMIVCRSRVLSGPEALETTSYQCVGIDGDEGILAVDGEHFGTR